MINEVLKKQIEKYNPNSLNDIKNAIREMLQKIILCELGKTDFFNNCVFYGGTSLRIFHNLNRFSEDLDFTIFKNKNINLIDYLEIVKSNINNYELNCNIKSKVKTINTSVESHYLQFILKDILDITYPEFSNSINSNELISIKVELEHTIIENSNTELLLLTYPTFCQVRLFTLDTLFASKLLAIKNRNWKSRVKGRDYYDYLFYIENNVKINMAFLKNGLIKFKAIEENETFNLQILKNLLLNIFNTVNYDEIKNDIIPFIKNNDNYILSLNKDIFIATIDLLKEFK